MKLAIFFTLRCNYIANYRSCYCSLIQNRICPFIRYQVQWSWRTITHPKSRNCRAGRISCRPAGMYLLLSFIVLCVLHSYCISLLCIEMFNPLDSKGNSATSNNMKLVHWPLFGGLLHLVQRGGAWAGWGSAQSHPRCTKCNNPLINGQCSNYCIVRWWSVALRF